jgi:hypothetical protein
VSENIVGASELGAQEPRRVGLLDGGMSSLEYSILRRLLLLVGAFVLVGAGAGAAAGRSVAGTSGSSFTIVGMTGGVPTASS